MSSKQLTLVSSLGRELRPKRHDVRELQVMDFNSFPVNIWRIVSP